MKRVSIFFLLLLAACSRGGDPREDDGRDDGGTGGGEPPVVIQIASRSTAAGNAEEKTVFPAGTPVGIASGGKEYKYLVGENGTLTAENGKKIYFKAGEKETAVEAFYPYNAGGYSTLSVLADQNATTEGASNYYLSDVLHAARKATTPEVPLELTFHHAMSKLVFNVTSLAHLPFSSLKINGQPLSASFAFKTDGTVNAVSNIAGATSTITAGANANGTTYRAIIIPRDGVALEVELFTGNKKATVTLPSNDFKPGEQYTYGIDVNKGKLEITLQDNGVTWENGNATIGDPTTPTFHITLSGEMPTINVTGAEGSGTSYTTTNSSFSITYTHQAGESPESFLVKDGLCDTLWKRDNDQYTFTCNNIRSDLWLECNKILQVGDYYYSDGTFSPKYTSDAGNPCIGIVFKVDAGRGDNKDNYEGKLPDNIIHGYVVALRNANTGGLKWSTENVTTGAGTDPTSFDGYANTRAIQNTGGNAFASKYPAASSCVGYTPAAPAGTSGWYLPSGAQIKAFYDVRDLVQEKITTAGGTPMAGADYWTSTTKSDNQRYHIYWNGGSLYDNNNDGNMNTRAILTF